MNDVTIVTLCAPSVKMYTRVNFELRAAFKGWWGHSLEFCLPPPPPLCQYAHYDNPVCRPSHSLQIHISPPL